MMTMPTMNASMIDPKIVAQEYWLPRIVNTWLCAGSM